MLQAGGRRAPGPSVRPSLGSSCWQGGGRCLLLKSWDQQPPILGPATAAFPSTSPTHSPSQKPLLACGTRSESWLELSVQVPLGRCSQQQKPCCVPTVEDSSSALTGSGPQDGQLSVQAADPCGRSPPSCHRWMAGRLSDAAHVNAFPQP